MGTALAIFTLILIVFFLLACLVYEHENHILKDGKVVHDKPMKFSNTREIDGVRITKFHDYKFNLNEHEKSVFEFLLNVPLEEWDFDQAFYRNRDFEHMYNNPHEYSEYLRESIKSDLQSLTYRHTAQEPKFVNNKRNIRIYIDRRYDKIMIYRNRVELTEKCSKEFFKELVPVFTKITEAAWNSYDNKVKARIHDQLN